MRAPTIVICGGLALGAAGCGGSAHTALSVASPPSRVSVSALIAPGRVAIDPARLGAGPITLTVTNQAARAERLLISSTSSPHAIARSQRIAPQGTTQMLVDLRQGTYSVTVAGGAARTDAQRARQAGRAGRATTRLRVGRARGGSGAALLVP